MAFFTGLRGGWPRQIYPQFGAWWIVHFGPCLGFTLGVIETKDGI